MAFQFTLHVIFMDAQQREYGYMLAGLGTSIAEIFYSESGGAIVLQPQVVSTPVFQQASPAVSPGLLGEVAERHVLNTGEFAQHLGLIIAPRWFKDVDPATSVQWLGVMFDTDTMIADIHFGSGDRRRPRECCAIFTESLNSVAQATGQDLSRLVARTAVHEIGHLFNLKHSIAAQSFMTQTRHITNKVRAFSRFEDHDRLALQMIGQPGFEHVRPGSSEFK